MLDCRLIFNENHFPTGVLFFRDFKRAKFHLVDLAGSEKAKKTQATGERFKEGKYSYNALKSTVNLKEKKGAQLCV